MKNFNFWPIYGVGDMLKKQKKVKFFNHKNDDFYSILLCNYSKLSILIPKKLFSAIFNDGKHDFQGGYENVPSSVFEAPWRLPKFSLMYLNSTLKTALETYFQLLSLKNKKVFNFFNFLILNFQLFLFYHYIPIFCSTPTK